MEAFHPVNAGKFYPIDRGHVPVGGGSHRGGEGLAALPL